MIIIIKRCKNDANVVVRMESVLLSGSSGSDRDRLDEAISYM